MSNVMTARPLPATVSELMALRKVKFDRTINDRVETLLIDAFGNDQFVEYLKAVGDEEAVEGSLACDNVKAAEFIRDLASKSSKEGMARDSVIAEAKLATIVKALNVCLRRYNISRKDRKNMLGGQVVPGDQE
jgi:hypothetical protein